MVIGTGELPQILTFRSIRSAYEYVKNGVKRGPQTILFSRVRVNNNLSEEWQTVGVDAARIKIFLIRYKPTK